MQRKREMWRDVERQSREGVQRLKLGWSEGCWERVEEGWQVWGWCGRERAEGFANVGWGWFAEWEEEMLDPVRRPARDDGYLGLGVEISDLRKQ